MLRAVLTALTAIAIPAAASATEYRTVSDRGEFLSLVDGKELRIGALGIRIRVEDDGSIAGRASGWDLTGRWNWQDGYFCREMDWSGYEIEYNCQLVEVTDANNRVRFTVDRGAGDSAIFNLR